MKKFNVFCLKTCSDAPSLIEITPQLNLFPLSRREIFDCFFQDYLPRIDNCFTNTSRSVKVSISRSFFSPFNMMLDFRKFAFYIDYLKRVYKFLFDKIVLAYVCIESSYKDVVYIHTYIFFAKEVTNE